MRGQPSYVTNAPAAAHLYLQGAGLVDIAEQLGISPSAARQSVLEAGVELRGPGRPRIHPVSEKAPAPSKEWERRSTARNEELLALRASGLTLAEVGDAFGISRERVRQLVKAAAPEKLLAAERQRNTDILTSVKAAEFLGVPLAKLRRMWAAGLVTPLRPRSGKKRVLWSRKTLVEFIQDDALRGAPALGLTEAQRQEMGLFTAKEAAALLHVVTHSLAYWRQWKNGPVTADPCVSVGGRIYYRRDVVEAWARHRDQRVKQRGITLTINGRTMAIKEWARESGVDDFTIRMRRRRGVTGEALIARPDTEFWKHCKRSRRRAA